MYSLIVRDIGDSVDGGKIYTTRAFDNDEMYLTEMKRIYDEVTVDMMNVNRTPSEMDMLQTILSELIIYQDFDVSIGMDMWKAVYFRHIKSKLGFRCECDDLYKGVVDGYNLAMSLK